MDSKKAIILSVLADLMIIGLLVFDMMCLSQTSAKIHEANDRVAALEQQNDELKDEINSMTDALEIYESENASLNDALVEINDELDNQKDLIDKLQEQKEDTTEKKEEKKSVENKKDTTGSLVGSIVDIETEDTSMVFSATRDDGSTSPDVIKDDSEPMAVYEEETPKVNPPYEQHLTKQAGVFSGPSGKETYYNLNMNGVVSIMRSMGYTEEEYPYWVRDDGAKMFGDYVMVAANLSIRPKGTILECSLGTAIVVDTGGFAASNPTQLDIATSW